MTTNFTFVSPTAARLFAERWNRECDWSRNVPERRVSVEGNTGTFNPGDNHLFAQAFRDIAMGFNAAAQHAAEIAGEDSR